MNTTEAWGTEDPDAYTKQPFVFHVYGLMLFINNREMNLLKAK